MSFLNHYWPDKVRNHKCKKPLISCIKERSYYYEICLTCKKVIQKWRSKKDLH